MKNRKEALDAIKKSLNKIGYDNEKIKDQYPITTRDENVIYFDFIAFGHNKIQDTSTSCISVKYCESDKEEDDTIEYAKYSASPLLIISKKETVRLIKVDIEKKSDQIIELKYDELGDYFSKNRVKYDYTKIISSKYESEQLSFLNTNNLFLFASKINCELLGKEFKKAIYAIKDMIDENDSRQMADVTSIVMHVIAAKILNDKLVLKDRFNNLHKLLNELSITYGDYFDKNHLYKYGKILLDKIDNSLSKELSYRSIDNKILGNFYESTLFERDENKNNKLKRELGIYYTPSCIVNNMLKIMPIELIDYRHRYTLDASCGSGSLLIGAYKRLKELLPAKMHEEVQHEYLTDMILGIDIDKFACEVAKLELLLNSIPYGNGWNVRSEDFTKINNMSFKPNIIIANPPYEEKRKNNVILQKASIFLEKYIELLNDKGLIGIVLPQSFLVNKSCREARKRLIENIQLYEIWLLPKGIFDTNNCATTVIIGRKERKIENKGFKGKIVVQKSVSNFKKFGTFDFDFVCNPQISFMKDKQYKIIISPINNIISKLDLEHKLSDYVNDTQGIQIPYSKYPLISDTYKEGYSKYFRDARKGISRYKFDWNKQVKTRYIYYDPENSINKEFVGKKDQGLRLRVSKRNILESEKVVIAINSTPGTFWRVKAAIDYEGIYVSHSLWCFVPKDKENLSLEVIEGVLNSKITSLYLENKNLDMSLISDNIRNIPFPQLTFEEKRDITRYVKEIEENIYPEDNIRKIDFILYKAFGLDDYEINLIESYYENFTSGKITTKEEIKSDTVELTGYITEVDLDNNKIKANFIECNEEKIIKIDSEIPGWLLVENTSFSCRIDEEEFYESEFHIIEPTPVEYTYLKDEEINDLLISNYNNYESSKKKIELQTVKEDA